MQGISLFLQVELFGFEKIYVKGYHPFYLRRGTTDKNVFREIFLFKTYNITILQKPKIIIDAGANIGLSTLYFRRLFPEAKIFAIEPDESNFESLLKNIKSKHNIIPIRSALWHSNKILKIKNKEERKWAIEVEECDENHLDSFRAISIKSLMETHNIEVIDFLKLDIEGAERELFSEHVDQWLPKTKVLMIELHDWMKDGCSKSFFSAISRYNFSSFISNGMLGVVNQECL